VLRRRHAAVCRARATAQTVRPAVTARPLQRL